MSKDSPYSTGIFETIVNCHFGGLAVEFYKNGASYLALSRLPDFSKAVISFWFRIPRATLQAAYDSWVEPTTDDPHPAMFNGITPLVVFGDNTVKGSKIDSGTNNGDSFIAETWSHTVSEPATDYHLREGPNTITEHTDFYDRGTDIPLEPSYIGVDSNREQIENYNPDSGDPPPVRNVLRVNLQMSSKAEASGMIPIRISETFSGNQIRYAPNDSPGAPRSGDAASSFGPDALGNSTIYIPSENPFVTTDDYGDATDVYMDSNTEIFTIKLDNHEIKPDRWHIVTLSFDISGKVSAVGVQMPDLLTNPNTVPDHGSISSTCKGWIAVDDVNYKGANIRDKTVFSDYVLDRLSFSPNGLYTKNAIDLALTRTSADGSTGELAGAGYTFIQNNSGLTLPTYSYTPGHISASGYPMGIPVTEEFTNNGDDVEFAEFQMWVGKTLNTANTSSRRLFVDAKGKPVNPKVAAKALGTPAISLHGTGNWIKGKNLGTLGPLDPTGEILKYRPDPSLHGPQKPSDLKK